MALAFDTSNAQSGGLDNSFNLTAAATGGIAIMCVTFNSSFTTDTPKVGGSTTGVTQIGSDLNDGGGGTMRMYYFLNPSTSATAYSIHQAGADGTNFFVSLYSGASQTGQPDSNATNTNGASSSLTLSTTVVAANCWLVGFYGTTGSGSNSNSLSVGSIRNTLASTSLGDSNTTVSTGSQSQSWNGARTRSAGIIASIKPSVAAGPTGVKTKDGVTQSTGIKTYEAVALASVKSVEGVT